MLYKLTYQNGITYNDTRWADGVTHEAPGTGDMCGPGWVHAYESPLLAVLHNPIHANISNPILWEAEGEIGISDGLKCGTRRLTTIRQIPLPEITLEHFVRYAILCAAQRYRDYKWRKWAQNWLSGADRSAEAARAEAEAEAARAVAEAEAWAAESAAWAAARSAESAAWAAWAAESAAKSAWAAAAAAAARAARAVSIDFCALAELACSDTPVNLEEIRELLDKAVKP